MPAYFPEIDGKKNSLLQRQMTNGGAMDEELDLDLKEYDDVRQQELERLR